MWQISKDLGYSDKRRVKLLIREIPDKNGRVIRKLAKGEALPMVETIRDHALEQRWMRVRLPEGSTGYCLLEDKGVILLEKIIDNLNTDIESSNESTISSHVILAPTSPLQSQVPVSPMSDELSDSSQYFFSNLDHQSNASFVTPLKKERSHDDNTSKDVSGNVSSFGLIIAAINSILFGLILFMILMFALVVSMNIFLVTIFDLGWKGSASSLDPIVLAH